MKAITYAKDQIASVFNLLNICADGLDDAQYNWSPPGTSNSVAKSHVHALTAIDFFVMRAAKGGEMSWPVFASSHNLPAKGQEIWSFEGEIPLAATKEFGQQIQKMALEYVATLKDDDLDTVIDAQFFGKQPLAFFLQLVSMHTAGHAGDMAAVKGMQGIKGLPF